MKTILALLLALSSYTAAAKVLKADCTFANYQLIQNSLTNPLVSITESTPGLALRLGEVLTQEMGPTCSKIVDTDLIDMIPEQRTETFEISDSVITFNVVLLINKEDALVEAVFVSTK